jgi:oxygen-independent coproporphyrinogen-3 oxidase
MRQWCRWNLDGAFLGTDGFDYLSALTEVNVPTLALSATGDVFVAPPQGCMALLAAFGSDEKEHRECGKATGFSEDFDHGRIVNSSSARAEVWPMLAHWLSRS